MTVNGAFNSDVEGLANQYFALNKKSSKIDFLTKVKASNTFSKKEMFETFLCSERMWQELSKPAPAKPKVYITKRNTGDESSVHLFLSEEKEKLDIRASHRNYLKSVNERVTDVRYVPMTETIFRALYNKFIPKKNLGRYQFFDNHIIQFVRRIILITRHSFHLLLADKLVTFFLSFFLTFFLSSVDPLIIYPSISSSRRNLKSIQICLRHL